MSQLNKQKIIVANWKMHLDIDATIELLSNLDIEAINFQDLEVVICPNYLLVERVYKMLFNSKIKVGVQNFSHLDQKKGNFTGEISANMAKNFNCLYAILGHSERRINFAETNEQIATKLIYANKEKISPILCIGETLAENQAGNTYEVLSKQLAVLKNKTINNIIIAYEPVWAIGSGKTPNKEQINIIAQYINDWVIKEIEIKPKILYGGSVNSSNAAEISSINLIDGVLVGSASLNRLEFFKIIKAFE